MRGVLTRPRMDPIMIGGRRQRGTRQGNLVSGLLEPGTSGSVIWTKLHDGTRQVDSQPHAIPPFTSSDLYYHSWVKAKCQHSILHHNRRGTNAIDADTTGSYLATYLPTYLGTYLPRSRCCTVHRTAPRASCHPLARALSTIE